MIETMQSHVASASFLPKIKIYLFIINRLLVGKRDKLYMCRLNLIKAIKTIFKQ